MKTLQFAAGILVVALGAALVQLAFLAFFWAVLSFS